MCLSPYRGGVTQTSPPLKPRFTTGNATPGANTELFALPATLKRLKSRPDCALWLKLLIKAYMCWVSLEHCFGDMLIHFSRQNLTVVEAIMKSLDTQAPVSLSADRSNRLIAKVPSSICQIRPKRRGALMPPTQQAVWVSQVKLQPLLL